MRVDALNGFSSWLDLESLGRLEYGGRIGSESSKVSMLTGETVTSNLLALADRRGGIAPQSLPVGIDARELLAIQVQASALHLRVELLSRVVDSFCSAARRLSNVG